MNRTSTICFMVFFCVFVFAVLSGDDEPEAVPVAEECAGKLYRSAFESGMPLEMRKAILREVVRKHPDSHWTDDAIWVLARLADMNGNTARAVLWRRRLLEDFKNPSLQLFTSEQIPYRTSRIPQILFIVETAGLRYAHDGENVFSFNPLPFLVHDELGLAYLEMGHYDLAGRHYRKAWNLVSHIEILRNLVEERMRVSGLTTMEDSGAD